MLFQSLGLWTYAVVTAMMAMGILIVIVALNWYIDNRRTREALAGEVYQRYQRTFPKLKRDLTLEELRSYDGLTAEKDYRILTAIDGVVFDVTGRWDLYGPDRPYCRLAGRDASRCLVKFETDLAPDHYDALDDLSAKEVENLEEWRRQYTESFPTVGRLLKPGEARRFDYSDDEC